MKKTLLIICIVFLGIMLVLYWNLKQVQNFNKEVQKFNAQYEFYNREGICGIDITTVINKAYDNNEKFGVEKDENGYYIPDNENSINIYVKLKNTGKTYKMENIKQTNLESFVTFFGEVEFKCDKIEYHKSNGKISVMTFESLER